MTEIIDGKGLAKKIRENLKKDVDELRKVLQERAFLY